MFANIQAAPSKSSGESIDARQPGCSRGLLLPKVKKRRTARACDECRRDKVKCDGKMPCAHCIMYDCACTYDKPNYRRVNPSAPQVEALQKRVRVLSALLKNTTGDYLPLPPTSTDTTLAIIQSLPARPIAFLLVERAFRHAGFFLSFLHKPSFLAQLHDLYSVY